MSFVTKRFHDFFRTVFSERAKNRCEIVLRRVDKRVQRFSSKGTLSQKDRNKFPFFLELTITINISATRYCIVIVLEKVRN